MGGHNVKKKVIKPLSFLQHQVNTEGILLYFNKYMYFNQRQYKFGPIVKSFIDPIDT